MWWKSKQKVEESKYNYKVLQKEFTLNKKARDVKIIFRNGEERNIKVISDAAWYRTSAINLIDGLEYSVYLKNDKDFVNAVKEKPITFSPSNINLIENRPLEYKDNDGNTHYVHSEDILEIINYKEYDLEETFTVTLDVVEKI